MKKYLFGLGTMLVGAGLMFVLMHGEVEAKQYSYCEMIIPNQKLGPTFVEVRYCKIKDLTCVSVYGKEGLSCVKS